MQGEASESNGGCPPLPRLREIHTDPSRQGPCETDLPEALQSPTDEKSPARWAYERLILYIRNFESQLDDSHEVAMGFAGGDIGVIRIEGLGYFDPDIVTFYGTDEEGVRTQLIQHVGQLNVMLRALPRFDGEVEPRRIGFHLSQELENGARDDAEVTGRT